ncbi:MAG: glycosyl transferase [Alphaproteobacteria bacterium]|nr:glycosyl transferase [Alphaproteobacteria bacterium]
MHYFTSITACYLPKARVLAQTLKKYNKNAVIHVAIADDLPQNFDLEKEDFDYIWQAQDFIKTANNDKWFFSHTVVELCTAIKAAAALHILQKTKAEKLIYLDPDIGVFGSLKPLEKMLNKKSLLLTPHQTAPALDLQGIIDEEICSLKHGVYNFGFFAVNNNKEGIRFLEWWNERLMNFCYDDIANGLFTDQKWGDLAPALFDFVHIVREPEYNVATWNLANRKISGNEIDGWKVNGRELKFYHFTGFDSGAHRIMLARHANPGDPVWNLSLWYENMLQKNGQKELGKVKFKYACYHNGTEILPSDRRIFRTRKDVFDYFDDPFGEECCRWMQARKVKEKSDILQTYKDMLKYKILYKLSIGKTRRKNKEKYRSCKKELQDWQKIINNAA